MHLFITILIMEILVGSEVDIFVPSFPDLQRHFNVSTVMVELLLAANLVAHCITALVVGNLGDRFGRKSVIIIGLIVFIIGSLFCTLATSYYILLLGRILQGIGISGPAVLGYIVLADLYSVEEQQRMMGTLNGAISLAMAFAPVLGSYVDLLFTWRGNFALLLILSVLCLILGKIFIPKGHKNEQVSISLTEYELVFSSRKAMYYIITIVFTLQAYWLFIGLSPILYMRDLGVPLQEFGLYQGALAVLFSIISFSSGYLLKTFGQSKCFFLSIVSFVIFIIASTILIICKISDPLIITLVTLLVAIGSIFPINILWPIIMGIMPEAKGRITAIVVSGRLIVTAICIQIASYFYDSTFKSIAIGMSITIVISLIACYKLFQEGKVFNAEI